MRQTAVECLIQELQNNFAKQLQDMYESNQLLFEDVFIKAKEMEKEQIIMFGAQCMVEVEKESGLGAIKIYELTFKQQQ